MKSITKFSETFLMGRNYSCCFLFNALLVEALQEMAHELSALSTRFVHYNSLIANVFSPNHEYWLWLECFEVIQCKRKQMPLTKMA
jgi:hypothetical protein